LVLSVIATYTASIVDSFINGTFLAGASGLPFKYSRGTLFGHGTVDYPLFAVDVVFWFIVISILWIGIKKVIIK